MSVQLNRIQPVAGPEAYKTYEMSSPLSTHWRPATCAEANCQYYADGFQVRVEGLAPQVLYAVQHSGRKYTVQQVAEGETYLAFEAGQPCLRQSLHRVRVERPPLYLVRDGDWRGNPRGTKARLHQNPENWVEDFATHQQAIKDEIEKG
ncbi:hypothetical protein [Streptomyces canus]|uniref:hypothetical protein n=1 Tax=Streptomyces canus TaxID=58343 RepID=UPI00386E771C|nr:hypothetical protein OH824_14275 [Streptomyces canus]